MTTNTIQADRVTRARTRLLLDHPFFGVLALRLQVIENPKVETAQTNGTTLEYNPDWTATLNDAELTGTFGHETGHCALAHPYRCAGRDLKRWNVACDYALNPMLIASGLTLPAGALIDPQYDNMSAEQIYALLQKDEEAGCLPQPDPTTSFVPAPQGQPGPTAEGDQPGDQPGEGAPGEGTPGDGPGSGSGQQEQQMTETDWQVAAEQAANVTRKAGNMPGDMDRAIKEARATNLDWVALTREFIENTIASDYSWTSPNRRYVAAGLYMPGTVKENVGRIAVAIDTSGSVSPNDLTVSAGALTEIMDDVRPAGVDVIYCDSRIQSVETFTPDDDEIVFNAKGGGGTRFQPVMDWIVDQDEPPIGLIYITDLASSDINGLTEPGCPVLWLTPEWVGEVGPFGETVRIPATA